MFENLGFQEIALIAIVFLVFFGPKKIPEVMHGIGRGVREFRRAMDDMKSEITNITAIPRDDTTIHRAPGPGQAEPKAAPGAHGAEQTAHTAEPSQHETQTSTGE